MGTLMTTVNNQENEAQSSELLGGLNTNSIL